MGKSGRGLLGTATKNRHGKGWAESHRERLGKTYRRKVGFNYGKGWALFTLRKRKQSAIANANTNAPQYTCFTKMFHRNFLHYIAENKQ